MRALRGIYMDLNSVGCRKRQDLLSKLGAWEPWERREREKRKGEEWRKIYGSIKKIIKNWGKVWLL